MYKGRTYEFGGCILMLRKFLCLIGIHKYESELYHLRDEGNKSICRVESKCIYCGKVSSSIMKFPKL